MNMFELDTDKTMMGIAEHIVDVAGDAYGFMVLVFPKENRPDKVANYISNCNREDMIKVLREKANVLEASLDIPNKGNIQ